MLTLAACGAGGGDDGVASESVLHDAPADTARPGDTGRPNDPADAAAAGDRRVVPGVDLGTADVDPASDVPTNPFPDLVVDDVRRGKKVNLRNLLPADDPVLLWLWAPH